MKRAYKIKAADPAVAKELQNSLGRKQLDPFDERYIDVGAQTLMAKLKEVQKAYPNASLDQQIASAVSRYNGGSGKEYPKSDNGTSPPPYANDVLARAKWLAQSWDAIGTK